MDIAPPTALDALRAAEAALVDLGACPAADCPPPCNGALAKVRAAIATITAAISADRAERREREREEA